MNSSDRQLLLEINDRLRRIEALLPTSSASDHEFVMMAGTADDLQAAIRARNARKKAQGMVRRRSDG
jgi:hypothetical protein